jgi:DNA-binding transcriptional MerR regulator/methylmalonyl-CoA mutase cobalamin-binding subunit
MNSSEVRHPMGVTMKRTGLPADVIRAWERRHGAIRPSRTKGNQRLYTDADIRRLLLIRRAIEDGWRIGQIAPLADDAILRLIEDSPSAEPRGHPKAGGIESHLTRCLAHVENLNGDRLVRQLEEASVEMSRVDLLDRLLAELMTQVGEGCTTGRLRIAHEHLATAIVRSFLDPMRSAYPAAESAPGIVVGTPVFQHHELGALLIAATARSEGWRTTYLGPNLPAEEIAMTARHRGARLVALSITFPEDDPKLVSELRRLRRLLPDQVSIVAGGTSAAAYDSELSKIGATHLADPASFRVFLRDA